MSDDCLFCKIIAGDIPSEEVYSDDDVYAFKDINPTAPVHVQIIPKKHIACIDDATEEDNELLGKLILRANDVAKQLGISDDGFRYVVNTRGHGCQTVFHIHLHIIGGRQLSWPPG
jgi:histidine triad (HIT) family protein